jgi:hypothetical protein
MVSSQMLLIDSLKLKNFSQYKSKDFSHKAEIPKISHRYSLKPTDFSLTSNKKVSPKDFSQKVQAQNFSQKAEIPKISHR